jgi:hypothetical protein
VVIIWIEFNLEYRRFPGKRRNNNGQSEADNLLAGIAKAFDFSSKSYNHPRSRAAISSMHHANRFQFLLLGSLGGGGVVLTGQS